MAVSDPMPTDKRTRAYKDWLKREEYRQRMQELEGSVSLRGFSYSDNQMYSELSIKLATLRANLLKKYPSTIEVVDGIQFDRIGGNYKVTGKGPGERYLSGRGLNFVISAPTQFVNDFKNWAMRNQYSDYRSAKYPSFTARQYELFDEGKPVPTTIPGHQGTPRPAYTENQLGNRMKQCNWEVIGNNAHTRAPDSRGRSSDTPKWDGAQDRVNRWQPLVSAPVSDRTYGGIGLFPPTFWPSDLGEMPTKKDNLLDGIMEWLMDLVDTFFSTPQFGTRPFAVGKWGEEDYRLSQRDPTRPQTPVGDMEGLLANPEASAWLENQKMGILISVLQEMCLANTLYDMVYDSELSKSDEWVVLLEPSRSGDEEGYNWSARNLVMPFTTWVDKAMAHETWNRCAYVTIDGERVEVTREMLLEQGLGVFRQYVTDNASNTYRQKRPGPMDYNSLGLLTLAMNETVSFKNLISVDIFEQALDLLTTIWQDSQQDIRTELAKQNQVKIEAVDDQLKTLRDEVEKAEVKSYVLFTQTKGPRGGLYDGFSPQFSLQLSPAVDYTRMIVMTEKQQEELNQIYTIIYRKFADASIPKDGNDVIFKLGNKTLSYDEALAVKNEDRSYGYQRKFPSLERALGGRSITERFTIQQENQLTSLIGGFYGMSQEAKQTLAKIVPTTVNKVRTDREIAKLTQQLISAQSKVTKAKSQLLRSEKYFETMANTLTKEQRKVMTDNYLAAVKRGRRKGGEPTIELLKALGIPIPKVSDE